MSGLHTTHLFRASRRIVGRNLRPRLRFAAANRGGDGGLALQLVAVACLIIAQVPSRADDPKLSTLNTQPSTVFDGPLAARNMRPYNLLFLQFQPDGPDVLPRGASRLSAQLDIANNLLMPLETNGVIVVEDNEYQRLMLTWRRGLGHGQEAALAVPLLWRNGGFTDEILDLWHRLFGIAAAGDDNPSGRHNVGNYHSLLGWGYATGVPVPPGGAPSSFVGNGFGIGDVSATWKRSLGRVTPRAAVAVRAGLKLPTGNPGMVLGSGGADIGLMLDGRLALGREIILYAGAGGALLGHATRVANAERAVGQLYGAMEYRPNSRDRFYWQIDGQGAPIRTGNPFADRSQVTATFGYRRIVGPRLAITASFSENGDIVNYSVPWFANIGPDFTSTLALEWRL